MKYFEFLKTWAVLSSLLIFAAGCKTSNYARDFARGSSSPAGKPRAFLQTTTRAVHLAFGVKPLFGDASLEASMKNFRDEARKRRSSRFLITNVQTSNLWWVLPPFSFFLTPIFVEVNGYLY